MNISLITLFREDELLASVKVHEMIIDTEEQLEQELIALGAKMISKNFLIQSNSERIGRISRLIAEHLMMKKYEKIIIVPITDVQPLCIELDKVEAFILHEGEEFFSVIWKGGGSSTIEAKYHCPLKKLWCKVRKVRVRFKPETLDGLDAQLITLEDYNALAQRCLNIRVKKDEAAKAGNYTEAAKQRDEEKRILKELRSLVDPMIIVHYEKEARKFLGETEPII